MIDSRKATAHMSPQLEVGISRLQSVCNPCVL